TTSGGTQLDGSASLTLNEWQHVAVAYSQTAGTIRLYVNGKLDASTSKSGSLTGYTSLTIGQDHAESGRYLNAVLDDIKIYSYALSPQQILLDMDGQSVGRFGPEAGSP